MPNQVRPYYALKLKRFFLRRICPRPLHPRLPRFLTTQSLPGAIGRIHACDTILTRTSPSGLQDYLAVGRSALDNCAATLAAMNVGFSDVQACLDLPCGHGRVLRWLQSRIDPARITACDLDRPGVDFCREEFGVKGFYSSDDLEQLVFPEAYDLIWVGSLLTHLDPGRCTALLRKLGSALRDGGVLIFTTHGESCLTRPGLRAYGKRFHESSNRLLTEFHRDGYCYAPYADIGYYGLAIHSEAYVKKFMTRDISGRLQLVRFQARGWHDHQDVWSYRKV